MIVHDDTARLHWKLIIVEKLIKGKDGCVLAVNIRMENYRTLHPIVKLYQLEVSNPNDEEASGEPNGQESDPVPNSDRPRRGAAMKALHWISERTDTLNHTLENVENWLTWSNIFIVRLYCMTYAGTCSFNNWSFLFFVRKYNGTIV